MKEQHLANLECAFLPVCVNKNGCTPFQEISATSLQLVLVQDVWDKTVFLIFYKGCKLNHLLLLFMLLFHNIQML